MSQGLSFIGVLRREKSYHYLLNKGISLPSFKIENVLSGEPYHHAVFQVEHNDKRGSISWWVSPKRTRSYPYTRVYDSLGYQGVRPITIIPLVKDEGLDGDRDYLQWDTISMLSYVGVYVVISYYNDAIKNPAYRNKVTELKFDSHYTTNGIVDALNTSLSPYEWNEHQRRNIQKIANKVIEGYQQIERKTGVMFHSYQEMVKRITDLMNPELFKVTSRKRSQQAQKREKITIQPKEDVLAGVKSDITLKNHFGGEYTWTVDEAWIIDNVAFLCEMKYSKGNDRPKMSDVKDGFFKLFFYKNIEKLSSNSRSDLITVPTLGLTSKGMIGACFNYCPYFIECRGTICRFPPLVRYNPNVGTIQNDANMMNSFDEGRVNGILVFCMGRLNTDNSTKQEIFKQYYELIAKHNR